MFVLKWQAGVLSKNTRHHHYDDDDNESNAGQSFQESQTSIFDSIQAQPKTSHNITSTSTGKPISFKDRIGTMNRCDEHQSSK